MKFGEKLRQEQVEKWAPYYLDYDQLRSMIFALEEKHLASHSESDKTTSLTVPRPTNAAGVPVERSAPGITQETFFNFLKEEMRKIEKFTEEQVRSIRRSLHDIEKRVSLYTAAASSSSTTTDISQERFKLEKELEDVAELFLALEKYVNLNFMGFHKILKKHDRRLPTPCKSFFMGRLHEQSWVRGGYSDVMVTLSRVYATLRGDNLHSEVDLTNTTTKKSDGWQSHTGHGNETKTMSRKFWVRVEDISAVKYRLLQHLPVTLHRSPYDHNNSDTTDTIGLVKADENDEEAVSMFNQTDAYGVEDSQLVNSVYLDNYAMEVYHSRLEKTPGSIALRLRWYDTEEPTNRVDFERKTHRETWTGDVSIEERFQVTTEQVLPIIKGEYDLQDEERRQVAAGRSSEEIADWLSLSSEVIQAVNSKQLVPTLRSQYRRTTFQIPFDESVVVTLDTNISLFSERTKDILNGRRWYRDPSVPIPDSEITHFPHALLEIRLQLEPGQEPPEFVTTLQRSPLVMSVHKFSKYIHGASVLFRDDVRTLPYWLDEPSLEDSILACGADALVARIKEQTATSGGYQASDAKREVSHAKVEKRPESDSMPSRARNGERHWELRDTCPSCMESCLDFADSADAERMTLQKVEPKLFFANERTFLTWLQMATNLAAIAAACLAFDTDRRGIPGFFAMVLLPLALIFIMYAVRTFFIRSDKIRSRSAQRWDDPIGPIIITIAFVIGILIQFFAKLKDVSTPAM